jgi:uncharacterized protein DUF1064
VIRLTEKEFARLFKGAKASAGAKWRNTKTTVDQEVFDSQWEATVFQHLRIRQRLGEIRHLQRQIAFPLMVRGVLIANFVADFVFEERVGDHWERVIADAKSSATRRESTYRLKAKLMARLHGKIRELVSPQRRRRARRRR